MAKKAESQKKGMGKIAGDESKPRRPQKTDRIDKKGENEFLSSIT
jgi:hypothetical protein